MPAQPGRGTPARGAASQVQDQRPHAVPTRASRRSACRTAAGTDVNLEPVACEVIEGQPCEFPCGQRGVHQTAVRGSWLVAGHLVRVIHPTVGDVGVDQLYGVARPRPADRPWVGLCMIASLDGTTV